MVADLQIHECENALQAEFWSGPLWSITVATVTDTEACWYHLRTLKNTDAWVLVPETLIELALSTGSFQKFPR